MRLTECIASESPSWFRKGKRKLCKKFKKPKPKIYVNGRKTPGLTLFSVSLDLTKCRYSILAKAKSIIKNNLAVMFAFTDINCSFALKLNEDKFHYFNSEDELRKVLQFC